MESSVLKHEGKKYLRVTVDPTSGGVFYVDVYAVLAAFGVECPACAHAVKKLLAPGQRGKGDKLADLVGARAAVDRAIELEQARIGLERMRREQLEKKMAEMANAQPAAEGAPTGPVEGPLMQFVGDPQIEKIPLAAILEQSKQVARETEDQLAKVKDELPAEKEEQPEKGEPIPFKVATKDLTEHESFGPLPNGAAFMYEGAVYRKTRPNPHTMDPTNAVKTDGTKYEFSDGTVVITSKEAAKVAAKMAKMAKDATSYPRPPEVGN